MGANQTIISNDECSKSTGFVYSCNLEELNDTLSNGTTILKHYAIIGAVNASYDGQIFDEMMCTMNEGRGECQGDSGGPLTVNENGKHILVGVVSWSDGCAKDGLPGVKTSIPFFREWIEDTIEKNGGAKCIIGGNGKEPDDDDGGRE